MDEVVWGAEDEAALVMAVWDAEDEAVLVMAVWGVEDEGAWGEAA